MKQSELRDKNHCSTCERRMPGGGCFAFKEIPEKCWAWTDDKDWLKKVKAAVKEYMGGKAASKE